MKAKKRKILNYLVVLWIGMAMFINLIPCSTQKEHNSFKEHYSELNTAWQNYPEGIYPIETPYKPENYNFHARTNGNYRNSHYGTHDWIADAALRLLYEENPNDWNWLLHNLNDPSPKWDDYGTNGIHNPVRSYYSFLFATQMPDMDKDDSLQPIPKKNPLSIKLEEEGEIIADNSGNPNTEMWVGQQHRQNYRWIPVLCTVAGEKYYMFITIKDDNHHYLSPETAWKMSKNAIRCLTYKKEGSNENWAKPEAAACYLGIMSHYIADVGCPPHVLRPKNDYYYLEQIDDEHKITPVENYVFHTSIESQTAKFTTWDQQIPGPEGYKKQQYSNFFIISLNRIGKHTEPIPSNKPPAQCVVELAQKNIDKGFGQLDGSGYADGFNKKGIYINSDIKTKMETECSSLTDDGFLKYEMEYRESDSPIISNALTYKEYFNTLEIILNWAIYYTACAMKWTLDQAKKQGLGDNLENFNPNQWVNSPAEEPTPLPEITEKEKQEQVQANKIHLNSWFFIIAITAPIVIPTIITPKIIKLVKKEKDLEILN